MKFYFFFKIVLSSNDISVSVLGVRKYADILILKINYIHVLASILCNFPLYFKS